MIYEALLAPTETPHTLRELKRALLTYDKVILVDPSDRDVIPSNAYMAVLGMPFFGLNMGPVRPLGKIDDYDDQFSRTLDHARDAVKAGLVEVRSTYQRVEEDRMTIGMVDIGGYPLDPGSVFWMYRSMASDPGLLGKAIPDANHLLRTIQRHSDLAVRGIGDGSINDIPQLPALGSPNLSPEEAETLARIGRARIASFIKHAGYCEAKNLVPIFSASVYGSLAQQLFTNAREVLQRDDPEHYWTNRSRVLDLCHEEFLVDEILDELEVSDVVKLRTKAWGDQAEAREALFESASLISNDVTSESDFNVRIAPLIANYRKQSGDLVRERANLSFAIKCEVGKASLTGGTALIGMLSQIGSPAASIALTLVLGGVWAFDRAQNFGPALRAIREQEGELKRGAGFGFHNFFSKLR